MKVALCSAIALAALCGLALADLYDDYSYGSYGAGYGSGYGAGYGSGYGISSWGGAGYGGAGYGGAGYGGGKSYIPVPIGGGAKGGSGIFGSLLPLLFLLILLPSLLGNNRAVPQDQVILLNSTLRSVTGK